MIYWKDEKDNMQCVGVLNSNLLLQEVNRQYTKWINKKSYNKYGTLCMQINRRNS